ncbi:MAG: dihydroxy-acid dehydratase, partial [Pseudomonadota bacterium]
NGDIIEIDAIEGKLNVQVSESEFEKRRAEWTPRETVFGSGAIWKYAQTVGPARNGAVTHPGGHGEKRVYADI